MILTIASRRQYHLNVSARFHGAVIEYINPLDQDISPYRGRKLKLTFQIRGEINIHKIEELLFLRLTFLFQEPGAQCIHNRYCPIPRPPACKISFETHVNGFSSSHINRYHNSPLEYNSQFLDEHKSPPALLVSSIKNTTGKMLESPVPSVLSF